MWQTLSLAVLGLSPIWLLAVFVQHLTHTFKYPTGWLLPGGVFNPVTFKLFEWCACKLAGSASFMPFHFQGKRRTSSLVI